MKIISVDVVFLQKPVTFGAVVDKNRLKTGLEAGDDPFEDIALGYFPRSAFDVKRLQLAVGNLRDPAFFVVNGIYQNLAVHCCLVTLHYRLFASISGLWGGGIRIGYQPSRCGGWGETCRDGTVHVPSKPGAINGISPEQVKFLNNQIMKLQRTSQTIFKE
jgi:hypothetical protein